MHFVLNLIVNSAAQVWLTFKHNWPYLVISTGTAAALKLYLDPERVGAFLNRHQKAGVAGATAVAVATPLCSCGTTAVALGMIANLLPWAPVVAFLAASPLTSPEELVYSAGLFGWRFAWAFFGASIFVGLVAGAVAGFMDRRGLLANQTRIGLRSGEEETAHSEYGDNPARTRPAETARQPMILSLAPAGGASSAAEGTGFFSFEPVGCGYPVGTDNVEPSLAGESRTFCAGEGAQSAVEEPCGCGNDPAEQSRSVSLRLFAKEVFSTGRRLLLMFFSFAFVGYFLNGLIPSACIAAIFGRGNAYSVPLAATLGFPIYVNTEASLPLVRAMIDSGMSQGAALAFLVTGAGTSIGAIAGLLTIARWRVVLIVAGTLWLSAVLFGTLYNLV